MQEDWRRSTIRAETEEAIADIVDAYDVRIEYERPLAAQAQSEGTAPQ